MRYLREIKELNQVEQWKLERHPLDVRDAVLDRYAREGPEAIKTVPGEVERLKWVGLYPQRQGGDAFMLRVKIPGGRLTAAQARLIGEIADEHARGPDPNPVWGDGYLDLTTRQDIQLHWIKIGAVPEIWRRLEAVGITTVQACGDSARNVLCCPVSGIDGDEVIDAYPIAVAITDFFTGNREYANLPRKFKMSVTGCREDCAQAEINDLALLPAGSTTARSGSTCWSAAGSPTARAWPPTSTSSSPRPDAVEISRAVAQLFDELGNRENRWTCRLRYLVQELGPETFRAELAERAAFPLPRRGAPHQPLPRRPHRRPPAAAGGPLLRRGQRHRRPHDGAEPGRDGAAGGDYGDGEIRLTTDQNLILTGVPNGGWARCSPSRCCEHSPNPKPFERGAVACTGNEFCRLAIVETKARAAMGARAGPPGRSRRGRQRDRPPPLLRVLGLLRAAADRRRRLPGRDRQAADAIVEGVDIGLGGSLGRDAAFIDWVEGAKPVTRCRTPWSASSTATAASGARASVSTSGRGGCRTTGCERPCKEGGPDMAGYEIRDEMNDIDEAPGKVWFWELERAVIDAGRCVQCGVCIAACPSDSLGIGADDLPKLVKMCTGCSLCWDFCPRGGLRYEATGRCRWPDRTGPDGRSPARPARPARVSAGWRRPTPPGCGRGSRARRTAAWSARC